MSLSHAAALNAVKNLKRRGLIAQDGRNDQEAAEMIEREAAGEDRTRRARDTRRAYPSARDAEQMERERQDEARDSAHRAVDEGDPVGVMESLWETASPDEKGALMQFMREATTDHRGLDALIKDRREVRRAKDAGFMKARKMGADDPEPFEGMPSTRTNTRNIEQFAGRRDWEETGRGTPSEDRRRHATDADPRSDFEILCGSQAASIGRI